MNIYQTTHETYLATLKDIYFNYEYRASPRGFPIREKTDYTFRIENPTSEPIITKDLERNKVIADYTAKEIDLYNSCSNKVEDFAKASKFWEKLANPDGTVNSAYGYLIWAHNSHGNDFEKFKVGDQIIVRNGVWNESELAKRRSLGFDHISKGEVIRRHNNHDVNDRHPDVEQITVRCGEMTGTFTADQLRLRTPWEYCLQALITDKDTRQAILRFSLPEHFWVGNKDMTCTLHGNWLIRNDKLHLSVVLRSNNWNKGILYDLPFFCSLMDKMLEELRPYYPTLNKGHYTHTAHSAHIYEKDEKIILSMLGM